MKTRRGSVPRYKSAHQDKDALGSSGLGRGLRGNVGPMSVWDALLVSVQDENHSAIG